MDHATPDKWRSAWLAPAAGHDVYYRGLTLRAAFTFERFTPAELTLYDTFAREILPLLGDHRLNGHAPHKRGQPTEQGHWIARSENCTLLAPLSSVVADGKWPVNADSSDKPWFSAWATRRTGDQTLQVWKIDRECCAPPFAPAEVTFDLSLRYVARQDLPKVEAMVEVMFERAAAIGCLAGVCDFVPDWTYGDTYLQQESQDWQRRLWSLLGPSGRAFTPSGYWKLLLSSSHVEKAGGISRLQSALTRAVQLHDSHGLCPHRPVIRPISGHAVVTAARLFEALNVRTPSNSDPSFSEGSYLQAQADIALMLHSCGIHLGQHPDLLGAAESHSRELGRFRAAQLEAEIETPTLDTSEVLAHVRSHPPSCIAGRGELVEADDDGAPSTPTGHHPDNRVSFRVGLDTKESFTVYGRMSKAAQCLWGLVLVGSLKRDRAAFVFDADRHGWDGYNPERPPEDAYSRKRATGKLSQFVCPHCDGRLFRLAAEFEFSDETPQPYQEHFTWFTLVGECVGCNWTGTVADHECA